MRSYARFRILSWSAAAFLLLTSHAARAQVSNPGFENGLDGWEVFIGDPLYARVTTDARAATDGAAGLLIEVNPDSWDQGRVWQDVTLPAGLYRVTANFQVFEPGAHGAARLFATVNGRSHWVEAARELPGPQVLHTFFAIPAAGGQLHIVFYGGGRE